MTMSFKSSAAALPLYLGEFELLVLLAILRLDGDAYGVTIKSALDGETSRDVTLGAIYKTLGRLEDKGYVSSRLGDPTPVSYTHLRAHETPEHLVCRLLLEKKKKK